MRALVNWANLATPAGLVVAAACCRGPARRARRGLWIAHGYRPPLPNAGAFTLGNVVLLRAAPPARGVDPVGSVDRTLLGHEDRHATQYAWCGGIVMPVIYGLAAGWSWVCTGDPASANPFERHAGLQAGGYRRRGPRPVWIRLRRAVHARR